MNWENLYRNKVTDADTALATIKSGDRIYIGGGAGVPVKISQALVHRADTLRNVEITHILTFAEAPYTRPEYQHAFRVNALFIGSNVRQAVREGRADFTPIFLSEIPGLFRPNGPLPLDVVLISVSPPDEHGFCSFGVEVGTTKPAAENARIVIAEINKKMPRTLGDSFIHLSRLTHIIETDYPLPEAPQGGSSPLHLRIGEHIAEMIPDGATLQMGIGSIPDAVLQNLGGHRDLGVHTELFSDGIIDLVENGVINCARKTFHAGKMVVGFLFGTQRLYDFVDNNPIVELHPTDYVNDPFNISRNDRMVAVNGAIEVDLTGQVCADSIGPNIYSGVGGQLDFIRGAARAKEGLPIIALLSTAKRDTISRIVPMLTPGAGVTTTRNDVHFVVTEYGIASLYGKTIRQRAQELINIAHPNFRDELKQEGKKLGIL
ncbi:MAG: 4-hydroxybutyrate CoA-transferase [Anaerolineae bacterium]|nr:4-hydroxybutyrate CoA-transferase [Anaerolineae bacterium]MCO5189454.1 4-hydroxybutyrate CoA-transferase [Anaerolineae bacterium]MCO5195591.1 4-hydroxybutyrate CoA-transferase [Anaerolineae bacterium]MCO5204784.1 4-hydroxybutyrate CoA-transferase [Anaerolineae bacterium]